MGNLVHDFIKLNIATYTDQPSDISSQDSYDDSESSMSINSEPLELSVDVVQDMLQRPLVEQEKKLVS